LFWTSGIIVAIGLDLLSEKYIWCWYGIAVTAKFPINEIMSQLFQKGNVTTAPKILAGASTTKLPICDN
jgi:hypothetical protein